MTAHVHRWLLSPNGHGPTSTGVCSCGEERIYDNRFVGDLDESGLHRSSTGRLFRYRPNQVPSVGQSKKGMRVLP